MEIRFSNSVVVPHNLGKSMLDIARRDIFLLIQELTSIKYENEKRCVVSYWDKKDDIENILMTTVKIRFQIFDNIEFGYGKMYNYIIHRAKDFSCSQGKREDVLYDAAKLDAGERSQPLFS